MADDVRINTVGLPPKNHQIPKNIIKKQDLQLLWDKAYANRGNSYHSLSQNFYEQICQQMQNVDDFYTIYKDFLPDIIQDADETNDKQDGIIGTFKQGGTGDCYFLALLQSIASKEDKDFLKDTIINNGDGSYTVKFKGVGIKNLWDVEPEQIEKFKKEGITVTEKELEKAHLTDLKGNRLIDKTTESFLSASTGDKDVRILEFAFNKYLYSGKSKISILGSDWGGVCNALPYHTYFRGKTKGKTNVAYKLLTGKETTSIDLEILNKEEVFKKLDSVHNKLLTAGTKPNLFNISPSLKNKKISGPHAYSVCDINPHKKEVALINPWDNAKKVTITYDEFYECFIEIEILE